MLSQNLSLRFMHFFCKLITIRLKRRLCKLFHFLDAWWAKCFCVSQQQSVGAKLIADTRHSTHIVQCSVHAMISSLQLLVLLISVPLYTDATCIRSGERPRVSVTNSTHLNVNWANAFSRNCHIKRTELIIQKNFETSTVTVEWSSKEVAIKTDMWTRHVMMRMTFIDLDFPVYQCCR